MHKPNLNDYLSKITSYRVEVWSLNESNDQINLLLLLLWLFCCCCCCCPDVWTTSISDSTVCFSVASSRDTNVGINRLTTKYPRDTSKQTDRHKDILCQTDIVCACVRMCVFQTNTLRSGGKRTDTMGPDLDWLGLLVKHSTLLLNRESGLDKIHLNMKLYFSKSLTNSKKKNTTQDTGVTERPGWIDRWMDGWVDKRTTSTISWYFCVDFSCRFGPLCWLNHLKSCLHI